MKQTSITILCIAGMLSACDKPRVAAPTTEPQRAIEAEPFHGEVYRSFSGDTALTLISRDECELRNRNQTLLCKYTKQPDALRVVVTALGTNQVLYFRLVGNGIQDNEGNILLSPQAYSAAIEQQRIQQEEAEKQRIAKQARIAAMTEESKKETKVLFKASLWDPTTFRYTKPDGEVVITDVSVRYRLLHTETGETESDNYWFGVISRCEGIGADSYRGKLNIFGNRVLSSKTLYLLTEADAKKAGDVVNGALAAWKQKYSELNDQQ